jgi:predicted small secreted protein
VSGNRRRANNLGGVIAVAASALLAGCAGNTGTGAGNGDPGAQALSAGETCQSIRSDLNRLDKEGVPSLVERQSSGQKLAAPQKAKADLYNQLLDKYLGARCHV